MKASKLIPFLLLLLLLFLLTATIPQPCKDKRMKPRKPCKRPVLYFRDILYNGKNSKNATAALIGAPAWGNLTQFSGPRRLGYLAAFDNPITLDANIHSPPVGRAQGFYLYNGQVNFSAYLGFSFVLNTTEHRHTINFAGGEQLLVKTRDISVIGGTGDFFMSRGIATLFTDAFGGDVYFRLRVDIKLYECW